MSNRLLPLVVKLVLVIETILPVEDPLTTNFPVPKASVRPLVVAEEMAGAVSV
jgi:hypothetical protein